MEVPPQAQQQVAEPVQELEAGHYRTWSADRDSKTQPLPRAGGQD